MAPTDPKLDRLAALLGQIQNDQKRKEERTKIFPGFPLKRSNMMRTNPQMHHTRPNNFELLMKQAAAPQTQTSTPPAETKTNHQATASPGDINNKSIHDIL